MNNKKTFEDYLFSGIGKLSKLLVGTLIVVVIVTIVSLFLFFK